MTTRDVYTSASGIFGGPAITDNVAAHIIALYRYSQIKLTAIGGTANAVTATLDPVLAATGLLAGMKFTILWTLANTGALTLTLNGGTPVAVVDHRGNALAQGAVQAGRMDILEFDGTNLRLTSNAWVGAWEHYSSVTPTAVSTIAFTALPVRRNWRLVWDGITRSAAAAAHWLVDYDVGGGMIGAYRVSASADWDATTCDGWFEFFGATTGDRAFGKSFSMNDTAAGDQRIHHRSKVLGVLGAPVQGIQLSPSVGTFDNGAGVVRLFCQ